jgi:ribonuclease E
VPNDASATFGALPEAPTNGAAADARGETPGGAPEPVSAAEPETAEVIESTAANETEPTGPAEIAAEAVVDIADAGDANPTEAVADAEPQLSGADAEVPVMPGEELAPVAANSPEPAEEEPAKPKRRGWWSAG